MDNGVRTSTEKKKPQNLGCYDSVKFDKIALWATRLVIIHDKKMSGFESHTSPKLSEIIVDQASTGAMLKP